MTSTEVSPRMAFDSDEDVDDKVVDGTVIF